MLHRKVILFLLVLLGLGLIAACGSSSVEKTIFVAPQKVECVGVAPQECLLIKENAEDDWQFWYDPIESFEHEPGFLYELIVKENTVENPPADASSITLELVEVVNKEPVALRTVYIGPERVECEGAGPQLCYQYKENPADDWLLFYDEIDGFEYEEGFNYELLVAETRVENPPADGSATQLSLVEVVNKSKLPPSLIGTIWAAATIDGQMVTDDSGIVVGISEGRIGGFAGCNTYSGPYSVEGNQVSIGPLASTRKACENELMDQEQTYLTNLEQANSYSIENEELHLLDESGTTTLTFVIVEPADLEGNEWELVTYNDGNQALVSVLPDTLVTATFNDGSIMGSGGCNDYEGNYEVQGNDISIGTLAANLAFCSDPEGIMDQEASFFQALESAARFQIVIDRLELVSEGGELLATFDLVSSSGN
jgi:heat shock protein HslJ